MTVKNVLSPGQHPASDHPSVIGSEFSRCPPAPRGIRVTNQVKKQRPLRHRVRNELARRGLALARRAHSAGRVPFDEVVWLSRLAASADALDWWQRVQARTRPVSLANPHLATVLSGLDRDTYSIGTEALVFLDMQVRKVRPQAIFEFGSGASTVVLAASMASLHGEEGLPHVFSIEQEEAYLERTRRLLGLAGLTGHVRLAHRPLEKKTVLGRPTRCYQMDDRFLCNFLTAAPDLLLIDGPSGRGDVRYGTLPLILPHVRRPCRLFLDDALRSDELRIALLWRSIAGFEVDGIHLVGHGLLEGRLD